MFSMENTRFSFYALKIFSTAVEGYAVVPNLQGQCVAFVIDKAKDIASPVDDFY